MSFMYFLIFCGAVLDASIRVMHRGEPVRHGDFECSRNMMHMQTLMHTVSHYFSRSGVSHQVGIRRPLTQRKVGDIGHPYQLRLVGYVLILLIL